MATKENLPSKRQKRAPARHQAGELENCCVGSTGNAKTARVAGGPLSFNPYKEGQI